jgi:hypothetical protein
MKYQLLGPEGYADRPDPYDTPEELAQAAAKFLLRFVHQGYYTDTRMTRRPLDWVVERLSVEIVEEVMTAPEAYARYVSDNLDRIASDGWVPVCYNEFLDSEECAEMLAGAATAASLTPSDDGDWRLLGHVAVDSGQLLVCDPCYIESEWKTDSYAAPAVAPAFRHRDGTTFYCVLHGEAPVADAIGFGHFEEIIQGYGMTANAMQKTGDLVKAPPPPPCGEFSYTGCCEATGDTREKGGPLEFKMGHEGGGSGL